MIMGQFVHRCTFGNDRSGHGINFSIVNEIKKAEILTYDNNASVFIDYHDIMCDIDTALNIDAIDFASLVEADCAAGKAQMMHLFKGIFVVNRKSV